MRRRRRVKAAVVVGLAGLSIVALLLAFYVARPAGENILLNPGFEEEDMSMWDIRRPEGGSRPRRVALPYDGIYFPDWDNIDNEIRDFGDYSLALHFTRHWARVNWDQRISQTVIIEISGYYDFSVSYFVVPPSDPPVAGRTCHAAVFFMDVLGPDGWGRERWADVGAARAVPLEAGDIVRVSVNVNRFCMEEGEEFIGLVDNVSVVMTREFGAWSRGTFVWLAAGVFIVTAGAVLALTRRAKTASNR